jgi:hypothetical protein
MTGGYDPNSTSADAPLMRARSGRFIAGRELIPSFCRAAPDRGRDTKVGEILH